MDFSVVKQLARVDCGAACLSFVLKQWGYQYSTKNIEAKLTPPGETGYSLAEMKEFALLKGFKAFLFSGTIDDVRKHTSAGRPCIIVYMADKKNNHAVVVTEVIDNGKDAVRLKVMDTKKDKLIIVDESWLLSRWQAVGSPLLLIGQQEEGGDT